jgi:N-glycosylase/DNA lyase
MTESLFVNYDKIEHTIIQVCDYVEKQRNACFNWKDFNEEQLWVELVSCILGSRVRFETARACSRRLYEVGLLNIEKILEKPATIRKEIRKKLSEPIYPPFSKSEERGIRYRYPNSKSQFIVQSAIGIYTGDNISDILSRSSDGPEARQTLIEKCKGIGPKQASLFLRNIRFSDDLAILDCHVNRYMDMLQLSERYRQINVTKLQQYLKKENILRMYAISKNKSVATMDIGIWTVMRLIKKEARQ